MRYADISKNFLYHFSQDFNRIKPNLRYQNRQHKHLQDYHVFSKWQPHRAIYFPLNFICFVNRTRGKTTKNRNIDCVWQCWFSYHRAYSPQLHFSAPQKGNEKGKNAGVSEAKGTEYHNKIIHAGLKAQGINAYPHNIRNAYSEPRMNISAHNS